MYLNVKKRKRRERETRERKGERESKRAREKGRKRESIGWDWIEKRGKREIVKSSGDDERNLFTQNIVRRQNNIKGRSGEDILPLRSLKLLLRERGDAIVSENLNVTITYTSPQRSQMCEWCSGHVRERRDSALRFPDTTDPPRWEERRPRWMNRRKLQRVRRRLISKKKGK